MKKIFIYFLLVCSLSLPGCGGIDEGEGSLGQFSTTSGNNPEDEGPKNHRLAQGTNSTDAATDGDAGRELDPPSEEPKQRRAVDFSGESEPIITLKNPEETEEIVDYPVNLPLTHICIKNQEVVTYYLYKPGYEDHLCELHYSGSSKFWFARNESDFCEKKLIESLQKRIKASYTCYCGRPGGPDGIVSLTEGEGYKCGNEE